MFGFLRKPPKEVGPESPELEPHWQPLAALLAPRLRLQRELSAKHGWSRWLALDASAQRVVVTVWPEWRGSNPEGRQRMLREAEVCSQLHHPGIVPILSYGEQGEWCWFVRPWQEGRPLSSFLDGPRLDPALVRSWLRQLTHTLAYAHQRGVIHQGLHPDCIWIAPERVSVSDFVFTQVEAQVVGTGDPVPTPRFLAPEQVVGGELAAATNYFTLGSLAYELLSGQPAFAGRDPIQVIMNLVQGPPPDTSRLPPPLDEMVARLLMRDPEQRLSDSHQVLQYLEREGPASPSGAEMVEVLADLQAEGQTVSENEVFTLDPGRALEKLGRFRFPDAWEWLVSLCAAAAPLGAHKLEVEWKSRRLTMRYVGVKLSQAQLENFWMAAYAAHQGGIGYLARGLASALNEVGGPVEVASGGWKLRTARVQKERPGRALSSQLTVWVESCPEPDWEFVRRRFLFAPLPICWGGMWNPTTIPNRPAPQEGFSLRVDLLESPQWLAIVDGMSFPMGILQPDTGRVLVWGPLRLDAERRQLLGDELLARIVEQVQAGVEAAVEDFARAPESRDPRAVKLYQLALELWQRRGGQASIDQFSADYLKLIDEAEPAQRRMDLAQECFLRAAGWETQPEKFWKLARHSSWFALLKPDWETAVLVSQRAFTKTHGRLHWLLQCWLEWKAARPNLQQMGSLLYQFPEQHLDVRFDPLLAYQLEVEGAPRHWLHLLPAHWHESRAVLNEEGPIGGRTEAGGHGPAM